MLIVTVALLALYIVYLLFEKRANDKALASFEYVIHVNGIRGKTGVCRLLDAHLRGGGYKVFTKTTGSTPCYIDVNGVEHIIKRHGAANIREQLSAVRMAQKQGAKVLIMECMAVSPELQLVAQKQILKANIAVITNVRYDHIFEMGETLDDIAKSLAGTLPDKGTLFTADEKYYPYFKALCDKKGVSAVLCTEDETNDENQAIACAVGSLLNVNENDFQDHIKNCIIDFGAAKVYRMENGSFLNLFSVNDPQSTMKQLKKYKGNNETPDFIYNHRSDRMDRLLLFAKYFFPSVDCGKIIVMGEGSAAAARILRRYGCEKVERAADWESALKAAKSDLKVGIGNIKGQAYDMIEYLERKDEHE